MIVVLIVEAYHVPASLGMVDKTLKGLSAAELILLIPSTYWVQMNDAQSARDLRHWRWGIGIRWRLTVWATVTFVSVVVFCKQLMLYCIVRFKFLQGSISRPSEGILQQISFGFSVCYMFWEYYFCYRWSAEATDAPDHQDSLHLGHNCSSCCIGCLSLAVLRNRPRGARSPPEKRQRGRGQRGERGERRERDHGRRDAPPANDLLPFHEQQAADLLGINYLSDGITWYDLGDVGGRQYNEPPYSPYAWRAWFDANRPAGPGFVSEHRPREQIVLPRP